MKTPKLLRTLIASLIVILSGPAWAQTVTAVSSGAWNQSSRWSDGQNVSSNSGKNYFNNAYRLDASYSTRNSFQGNYLTLDGPNAYLRTGGQTLDLNLTLTNGGRVETQNTSQALSGTLAIAATGELRSNSTADRSFVIDSQVTGNGTLTLSFNAGDTVTLTNPANTFSGTFKLTGASGNLFTSTIPGSLGAGSTLQLDAGIFEPLYAINGAGDHALIMSPASTFRLGTFNHTFRSVIVGPTELAPGNYLPAALNALGGGTFEGTSGSITVAGAGIIETLIEAEDYDAAYGVSIGSGGTGSVVKFINNNEWMGYHNVNFGQNGATLAISYSSGYTSQTGTVSVRTGSENGTEIGTILLAPTGGWSYTTAETTLSNVSGTENLYLRFFGSGQIANVDWLLVSSNSAPSPGVVSGVPLLLGTTVDAAVPVEETTWSFEALDYVKGGTTRISVRLNEFWEGGAPSPHKADEEVLKAHEFGLDAFILIDYYDDSVGNTADYNWYEIGRKFAQRFRPNSAWLQSQGITDWGITIYSAFNEPEIPAHWVTSDNGIGVDFQIYRQALKAFADGVHSVSQSLLVVPGGYTSYRESGEWTARGYLDAVKDYFNDGSAPDNSDGTFQGLMLHNYDSIGKKDWTSQYMFDRHKSENGITKDILYLCDEFNNNKEGADGKAFLTSIWDQIGVVGNAGNGPNPVTRLAQPFSLNFLESSRSFGLTVSKVPFVPSQRAEVWRRFADLANGMEFTNLYPHQIGGWELKSATKKMWVWQNRQEGTSFPGNSVKLFGIPSDATKIEIHTYQGLHSVVPLGGEPARVLTGLPENQTLMFVANGTNTSGTEGLYGHLRLDLQDWPLSSAPDGWVKVSLSSSSYDPKKGYGWESRSSITSYQRNTGQPLEQDGHSSQYERNFLVDLPNGNYAVTVYLGDPSYERTNMYVLAEGQPMLNDIDQVAGQVLPYTFNVTVTDGQLTLTLKTVGAGKRWTLAGIEVNPQ